MVRLLSSPAELLAYDRWVKSHPEGSLWQSLEWKTYQEALGREVRIYVEETYEKLKAVSFQLSALVVIDKTSFGLSTWDIPRGPLTSLKLSALSHESFLGEIQCIASQNNGMSLFLSPSIGLKAQSLKLKASPRAEQPPATRIIDLTQSEEAILAQMKQKGRYNIRVAEKHGVCVKQSTDIDAFAALAQETARRDRFTAPPASRYQKFLASLPGAFLLLAYGPTTSEQRTADSNNPTPSPIAGLLGTIWNGTGIYYYGASDYANRSLMASYLLQWEAMKYCKAHGCHTYDLLGIERPSHAENILKAESRKLKASSWSGITRFKEQFGGAVIEYPPEQEIVLKPMIKHLLQMKRSLVG